MGKYITELERYKIEFLLKKGAAVREIAEEIGKCLSAVYSEIRRGTVELMNSDLTYRKEYCADYAQNNHVDAGHNKGRAIKLGKDYKTAETIERLIKDEHYSLYAVSCRLREEGYTYLCTGTIYSYIDNGYLNLANTDLPYGKEPRKKEGKKETRRPSMHNLGAKYA